MKGKYIYIKHFSMTEPDTLIISDCSLCKKDAIVHSINENPDGCKHEYCNDCIKAILSVNGIKKCPIKECQHIMTPTMFGKLINSDSFNLLPLDDETVIGNLSALKILNKIDIGKATPFQKLPIPEDLEFTGAYGKIMAASNFVKVESPFSAFNFINTPPYGQGEYCCTRIFIHYDNTYYAMNSTGAIVPFITHLGLFGRCPNCSMPIIFTSNNVTTCFSCKGKICLCCGLIDCTKEKLSNDELRNRMQQFDSSIEIPKVTFLAIGFNIPYVIKPFSWMITTFIEKTKISNFLALKLSHLLINDKKWSELTVDQKKYVYLIHKNQEIFKFFNLQFNGIPSKYFDAWIKANWVRFIQAIKGKNKIRGVPILESLTYPNLPVGIPIPATLDVTPPIPDQPQALPRPVFYRGVDALLAAADTLENSEDVKDMEPSAKKKRKSAVKPPSLITPAWAASQQIRIALTFSKLPGMPQFVYPTIKNPYQSHQYERSEMYREQIECANAYINMAIEVLNKK